MTVAESALAAPISAVRRFNRFYTKQIGVLRDGHLESPFSLTEVRVLYELAHQDGPTSAELARELGDRLRIPEPHPSGVRASRAGREDEVRQRRAAGAPPTHRRGARCISRASTRARTMRSRRSVERVSRDDWRRLTEAMRTIERVLAPSHEHEALLSDPPHQPGDIGWVVYRHGVLYAREYGWDERFEALVAQIVAEFVHNLDPRRERCWIAGRMANESARCSS